MIFVGVVITVIVIVIYCGSGQLILTVALYSDHGLARLVEAYRAHGHKAAKINPLLPQKPVVDSVQEITMMSDIIKGRLNTSGK